VITKHGRPAATMLSIEDVESLEETLEILGNRALMDDIRAGLAELERGEVVTLSKEEALKLVRGE
jgi:antitoxin YefM